MSSARACLAPAVDRAGDSEELVANATPVVGPRFFHRTIGSGRNWTMPPEWSIVEDIPGGWYS